MEATTLGLNIFTWVYFFQNYGNIPNVVSVDFQLNTFERVDKQYFFIILLADLVQYFLLSILQLTTHKFKYVQELKETTASRIFLYTRYFIGSYKLNTSFKILGILIIFSYQLYSYLRIFCLGLYTISN
ncbi:hypothetical protein pb186bvf_005038 [Paramecium bursaria]